MFVVTVVPQARGQSGIAALVKKGGWKDTTLTVKGIQKL
jgi:hypothetical protein